MHPEALPLGLYIHIPWCIKKCPYCDFNSHSAAGELPEQRYVDALLQDLQQDLQRFQETRSIGHIFIGGGTPSLFSPEALARLLTGVRRQLPWQEQVEITLEANPGTFESRRFAEYRAVGINRLSIGIQSFDDRHLRRLGRIHCASEAIRAVQIAHTAGFENINLDLMFGLPGASTGDSQDDIETAIALQPTHISLYQLTLEPNTYFHKYPPALPDDEQTYLEQRHCQHLLAEKGFRQYEISAYGLRQRQCRHNLNYWQFGDYLGIGAGAHGKITRSLPDNIIRTWKIRHPGHYLENTGNPRVGGSQTITRAELPLEFMMNSLRLHAGFSMDSYIARTGLGPSTLEPALSKCLQQGLLENSAGHYRCSTKGRDFLDQVLAEFVA